MRRALHLARLLHRACTCRHSELGIWDAPHSLWPSQLQPLPAHGFLQQRSYAAQGGDEAQEKVEPSKAHTDHEVAVMAYRAAMRGAPTQLFCCYPAPR